MNVKFYSLSTRPKAVEGAAGSFVNVTGGDYAGMWYCTGSDYIRLDNVAQEHGGEVKSAAINTETGVVSFKNEGGTVLFTLTLSDYITAEIAKLEGSATIATISNGVVTIKGGVVEASGKISNNGTDVTLAKVATTGKAEDITLDPNSQFGGGTQTTVQSAFAAVATAFDGLATQLEGLVNTEKTRATAAEEALEDRLDTLEGDGEGSVAYAVKQEETRATGVEATLSGRVDTNASAISSLQTSVTANATAISNEVSRATGVETALSGRVDANEDAISALQTSVSTNASNISDEITRAKAAEKANSDAIAAEESRATDVETSLSTRLDTLEGDGEGSIKRAVADGIASVVAGADSDFDTLKEVADWIAADPTRAAELTSKIDKNEDDIAAEVSRATGVETSLSGRVGANESAISALQTSVTSNTNAISALQSSTATSSYVDAQDAATLSSAKTYAGEQDATTLSSAKTYASEQDAVTLASAKSYADGLASNYATAAQGAKADTALQGVQFNGADMTATNKKVNLTVATGTANGTIAVNGTNIAVSGLGSAAYTDSSAYDATGSATTAETNAKAYADTQDATTLSSANAYTDSALTWLTTFPTA